MVNRSNKYSYWADNKEVLIFGLEYSFFELVGKPMKEKNFMSAQNGDCGCTRTWDKDEVPENSVVCKHGNYLIYYKYNPLAIVV